MKFGYAANISIYDDLPKELIEREDDPIDDIYEEYGVLVDENLEKVLPEEQFKVGTATVIDSSYDGQEEEDMNISVIVEAPSKEDAEAAIAIINKKLSNLLNRIIKKLAREYKFDPTECLVEEPLFEDEDVLEWWEDKQGEDLDESCNKFNNKRGKKMKDSKITKEMLDEAIEVAEAHGYKVVDESAKADAEKSKKELIAEAIEVAKAHGYKVVKEDEEPGATAETPAETGAEAGDEEQEIFTIQVTKEELEAIKSILDKVEYEDDGSADAEAAAAVVSAMDNENIYGPADE